MIHVTVFNMYQTVILIFLIEGKYANSHSVLIIGTVFANKGCNEKFCFQITVKGE